MKQKPLLILDLDESLIHTAGIDLGREADFYYKHLRVYKRPHLDEFLITAAKHFRLALWSMGTDKYVREISAKLLPEGLEWEFVFGRSQARRKKDIFWGGTLLYKSIDKLKRHGYDLKEITMIDNNPTTIVYSESKIVTILSYWGEADDTELLQFIERCPHFEDSIDLERGIRSDFNAQFLDKK